MACPDCDGIGFVYERKAYKSRHTGELYPDTMLPIRCQMYLKYFEQVKDPLAEAPIYSDLLCSAASLQHERIRDEAASKGKDGRRKM